MFRAMDFTLNGISSTEFGVTNIHLESGAIEEPLHGSRSIIEDVIPNKSKRYLFGVQKEPLEFTMTFSLLDEKFTYAKRLQIMEWLLKDNDNYRSLILQDFETPANSIHFYVIVINQGTLNLFGDQGYFQVNFRNIANSPFSPVYTSEIQNFSNNPTYIDYEMYNNSNIDTFYYPETWITLQGNSTGFSLQNLTNGGKIMSCTGLNLLEEIYINHESKDIMSSLGEDVYRFDKFAEPKNWLQLISGKNIIRIRGNVLLKTRSQFPLIV